MRLAQITGAPLYPLHIQGVKGEGHTLLAIPLRSNITLTTHPPLDIEDGKNDENIRKLQQLIENLC